MRDKRDGQLADPLSMQGQAARRLVEAKFHHLRAKVNRHACFGWQAPYSPTKNHAGSRLNSRHRKRPFLSLTHFRHIGMVWTQTVTDSQATPCRSLQKHIDFAGVLNSIYLQ